MLAYQYEMWINEESVSIVKKEMRGAIKWKVIYMVYDDGLMAYNLGEEIKLEHEWSELASGRISGLQVLIKSKNHGI